MLQSLRARLAFLFAGTLVLATVIAAVVVVSLYNSYNRDQTVIQLRNQVGALASYYQNAFNQGRRGGVPVKANVFSRIGAGQVYYAGPPLFPQLPQSIKNAHITINIGLLKRDSRPEYRFHPNNDSRLFIGVGAPIFLGDQPVGAVVLGRPLADVNNAWKNIIGLVGVGLAVGLAVALILATYVARRITHPLRVIGSAADKVARGDLDVNVIGKRNADEPAPGWHAGHDQRACNLHRRRRG